MVHWLFLTARPVLGQVEVPGLGQEEDPGLGQVEVEVKAVCRTAPATPGLSKSMCN